MAMFLWEARLGPMKSPSALRHSLYQGGLSRRGAAPTELASLPYGLRYERNTYEV